MLSSETESPCTAQRRRYAPAATTADVADAADAKGRMLRVRPDAHWLVEATPPNARWPIGLQWM